MPFTQHTLYILITFFIVVNLVVSLRGVKRRGNLKIDCFAKSNLARNDILLIIFEELIFFIALAFWSYVKAHQPDIEGLEKYMDFGFINSILRSNYFPPPDMWLSPNVINYYYFGHLVTAVLTRLTAINPAVTFNLMLSTIFAFCFAGSFSIAINLIVSSRGVKRRGDPNEIASPLARNDIKIICFSLLTAFIVTLGGNLHTIYAFTKGYVPADKPVPFWQVLGTAPNISGYWYPNATRFIPYTIHEFPSYSYVVSDLHGHVLDIPFVLFTIALLLSIVIASEVPRKSRGAAKQSTSRLPQPADLVGFTMTLPVLGLLLAVMYMTNAWDGLIYFGLSGLVFLYLFFDRKNLIKSIISTAVISGITLLLFILFSLPFQLTFKPFVSGIGVVRDHSPLWMLFILWGFFYYCTVGFLIKLKKEYNQTDIFVLLMIGLSTLLLIFPEIFYVKDIYPQHYRANTMFKLGYQAFIMLSICSGYIIYNFYNHYKLYKLYKLYNFLLFILLFLVSIYPFFSIRSYFNSLKEYKGLYGLSYLNKQRPDDYQTILWFNQNVKGQQVILEAVGDSYTQFSRISANTGLPTVLGWPVHEWLWRGSYAEPGKRVEEVSNAYTGGTLEKTKLFLKKYKIKYVVIGDMERQKYPAINENKFAKLGKVVYEFGGTRVYKINNL